MPTNPVDASPDQPGRKSHHNDKGKKPVIINGKQFTPEEYQKMVERRRAGDRTIDIANDNSISRKRLNDKFEQQKVRVEVEKPKEIFKIGGKQYSVAQTADLIKRRQVGETVIDIAKELGITKDSLRKFFDTNKIKVESKEGFTYIGRKSYNNEQVARMIDRRKNGESIEVIAKDNDLTGTTLRRFFNVKKVTIEGDLKLKPRGKNQPRTFSRQQVLRGAFPKEVLNEIHNMKLVGKSNRAIARRFNIEEKDLGQYLLKNKKLFIKPDSIKIGADIRSREDLKKMIEARKRGESVKGIALNNGIKEYSLGRYFQKNKVVPEYPEGTVLFGQKTVSKEKMDEICRRRLNGESIQSLANELGLNLNTLERHFDKIGIMLDNSVQREINRKYEIDHDFFKKIDSPTKAYMLGLIMTDGNIHKEHYSLRFDFQKKDKYLCEIARKSLSSNAIIVEREVKRGGPQARIQFNSKTLIEDLAKLGVEPSTKTYNNKFPCESVVPRQYQRDYIRGVMDGDGSAMISHRKGKNTQYLAYGISLSGTQEMVKGVQQVLVRDTGLTETKITKDKRKINNYVMTYHGTGNVAKIFSYLYPAGFNPDGNCLKRKYDRMKEANDKWQARQSRQ
jgi:hypothetical protein